MTILRDISRKLPELQKRLNDWDKQLDVKLNDREIKLFFILRHQDMPILGPLQRYVINEWEPRVARILGNITMERYLVLRDWLGINRASLPVFIHKENKIDSYEAKVVLDLRDEVKESASSTIRAEGHHRESKAAGERISNARRQANA